MKESPHQNDRIYSSAGPNEGTEIDIPVHAVEMASSISEFCRVNERHVRTKLTYGIQFYKQQQQWWNAVALDLGFK
jgi:hypothetical protein